MSLAPQAARHDLNLLQPLHLYTHPQINAAALRKMAGHLGHLLEDLILLGLFDPEIDQATKRAMLKASKDIEKEPLPLASVDMTNTKDKKYWMILTPEGEGGRFPFKAHLKAFLK